ncbi:MAG: hypothetical protein O9337_12385 [Acidovorax sp.]|uniref:hypothetical protein n=1 Tax=Acidovorax sp. TaxID=1872122 RepID=UPI0022C68DAE|nr:hypothetical protein [Acidovorax sp.]MCZ8220208.1 hypothetical protein [Acidovorax sp.]
MRAPFPHPLASCLVQTRTRLACLALLTLLIAVPPALAQSPHTHYTADAAEPGAATALLIHPASPAPTALAELPTGHGWQDAHHAVGQFPRGHADIVAWEKQQGAAPTPPPPSSHTHGGGDKAAAGAAPEPKPMHQHHRGHHGHHPMHGSKP